MAQKHSVACPSCGASLQVTKDSLIGKRVPCPSCKTPFVIQVPTGGYIPLADDAPLSKSSAGKSSTGKSSVQKSGPLKVSAADSDDIPLLDDEPSSHSRGRSSNLDAPTKSGSKRADSKSDTAIRESRKGGSGENIRPRSDSKTVKFTSQAESTEFDAMLADSSGTDLFDDDESKPRPTKRAKPGKESEADVETSEFDSMLADTDEQDEQVGEQLPPLRRNKPRTKADADEAESIATVEMRRYEDDDLPPAASSLAVAGRLGRPGARTSHRLDLRRRGRFDPALDVCALQYPRLERAGNRSESAKCHRHLRRRPPRSPKPRNQPATSPTRLKPNRPRLPAGTPSLLRHKEKERPEEDSLNGKTADPAAKPGAQKTEDAEATDQKPAGSHQS